MLLRNTLLKEWKTRHTGLCTAIEAFRVYMLLLKKQYLFLTKFRNDWVKIVDFFNKSMCTTKVSNGLTRSVIFFRALIIFLGTKSIHFKEKWTLKACKSKFQIVSDQYCCQSQNAGESTHQFVNLVIASTMSGRSSLLYNHIEIYNAIKLQWVEDGRTYKTMLNNSMRPILMSTMKHWVKFHKIWRPICTHYLFTQTM